MNRQIPVRCVIVRGGSSIALSADGEIQEASYSRIACRIMEGTVFVRRSALAA